MGTEARARLGLLIAAGTLWLAIPLAALAGWVRCPACGGSGKIPGPLVGPSGAQIQSYYGCTRCGGTRGDPINGPPGTPGRGQIWRADPPPPVATNPPSANPPTAMTPPREDVTPTPATPPGTPHPWYRHVVYGSDGHLWPAPGYRWLNDRRGDYRVVGLPGTPYGRHPHVVWGENGRAQPAPGYRWRTWWFWDYRVVGLPGTPHDEFPNVVWAERGRLRAAPGYRWLNGWPWDHRVVPVEPPRAKEPVPAFIANDPSIVRADLPPAPEPVPASVANSPRYRQLQDDVATLTHARGTLEEKLARVRERRARGEGDRGELEVEEARIKQMIADADSLIAFFRFQMRELAAGRGQ